MNGFGNKFEIYIYKPMSKFTCDVVLDDDTLTLPVVLLHYEDMAAGCWQRLGAQSACAGRFRGASAAGF